MKSALYREVTNLDIVTLRHIADAEAQGAPMPPAFADTLFRLSSRGYIKGDAARIISVTDAGRKLLRQESRSLSGLH